MSGGVMLSVKELRDETGYVTGVEIHDADQYEDFSLELLQSLDPRLGTYDESAGLITLAGVNRTVVYQAFSKLAGYGESPSFRVIHARLLSDSPG